MVINSNNHLQKEFDKPKNRKIINNYFNNFKKFLEVNSFFDGYLTAKDSDYTDKDLYYKLTNNGVHLYISNELLTNAVLGKLNKINNHKNIDILELSISSDFLKYSINRDFTGEKHIDYPFIIMQPAIEEKLDWISCSTLSQADRCLEEIEIEIQKLAENLFNFRLTIENNLLKIKTITL
jgi:hypothetical protein